MNTHKLNNKQRSNYRSVRAVLFSKPVLASAAILAALPLTSRADDDCCSTERDLNSLSFSARFGFNIGARFKNPGHIAFVNNRKTPDGLNFNYDNGYVLPDISGSGDGYTYNWGFEHANQVSPADTPDNHLALSRTTSADAMSSPWKDADVSLGGELVYRHEFGSFAKGNKMHWGIEAAGNFANIGVNDHASYAGTVTRTTDTFVPAQGAIITGPREGTEQGPGTLLNMTPISSGTTTGAATISGVRKIDADMWGFRVGPYLEMPLSQKVNLSLSGGFAGAWLDVDASWRETLSVGESQYPFAGGGHDHQFRFGGYVAANAEYQFAHDWSLVGGAQFQSLENYDRSISGRQVQMDLSNAIFVTLGLSYRF